MGSAAGVAAYRSNRVCRGVLLAALLSLIVTGTGCQAVILLGYLIGGPPSIDPDFEVQTKKSLAKKGVKVMVLCYAPRELKWDNEAVDYELAKAVAYRLNGHKISVIDPDRIHAWLDQNDNWDTPDEVGNVFDADFIVYIDMKEYGLYEENSSQLYRGRTEAILSVIEMDPRNKRDPEATRKGHQIYSKDISSRYPKSTPVSSDQYAYADFKKMYLSALSEEIGVKFYESFAGDDIPNTAL